MIWILFSIASVINALARPTAAGRHGAVPRRATISSINSAVKKNPEASNSVRMVRICMAMPPENARNSPPSTAMRQSRTSARSRYENVTTNDMA